MAEQAQPPPVGRTIQIPDFALVLLVGTSGSGKSTFARKHFLPTEVLSSDAFRGWVSDDETSLEATNDAFAALHMLASVRLRRRRLTVIDATNVQPDARKPLLALAREHDALAVAIVLDMPEGVCHERNRGRADRAFGSHVVRNQHRSLRQSLRGLGREGFHHVHVLDGEAEADTAAVERRPLWTDRRAEHGPFDIIGDVHGCFDELTELLGELGYAADPADGLLRHPDGRRPVFLGDIVDRGPRVVDTLKLVMGLCEAGLALCVPGNHDTKACRWLRGRNVEIKHGLEKTVEQIDALPDEEREAFRGDAAQFLDKLVSHYVLDDGKLVVAHAGMKAQYQGRASSRVRDFALYGETTGEMDEFGLPVRYPWAQDYRASAMVVYGHTPIATPEWLNRTICVDTGCVFGGRLTALRYPERELVSVPARTVHAVSPRPLAPAGDAPSLQWQADDLLHAEDVLGKRTIRTGLGVSVAIGADHGAAALEVMSRFAVDPRWLITLPPTMSPCESSDRDGYLEYPSEGFAYFRQQGVTHVMCQAKHMGSRAVLVVCRDEAAALRRFGAGDALGECFSRTGRRFFDADMHEEFLAEVRGAMGRAGLWEALETDWVCLDAEIMPWSAKARTLVEQQYRPVAVTGPMAVSRARAAVDAWLARGLETEGADGMRDLSAALAGRADDVAGYGRAVERYCWPVNELADLRVAPFHVLAAEGRTFFDRDHAWHMDILGRLCDAMEIGFRTESHTVDLGNEASEHAATQWWLDYTGAGGEGMVVKPLSFVARGPRGLVQPAVKVRGREYLRIIYGPSYTEERNLGRLRSRSLGGKRALATREFALGVEALDRFVRGDALRHVHECAFAILALESEPIDPRL